METDTAANSGLPDAFTKINDVVFEALAIPLFVVMSKIIANSASQGVLTKKIILSRHSDLTFLMKRS